MKKAPIRFRPYLKTVIWGGNKICEFKGIPQHKPDIGESWEISAVPGFVSVVEDGDYQGLTLTELIDRFGDKLLGKEVFRKYNGKFPLLFKLIDANDNLSVQVHPDENLAMRRHNCMGKSEMWYIIDADSDARIFAGLKETISPHDYDRHVAGSTLMDVIATHESHPGDVFFLPPGRVHSIGRGNLLAEIQQSSDVTYRIYDFDRTDSDGNRRELHTELAREAIDLNRYEGYRQPAVDDSIEDAELIDSEHFRIRRLLLNGDFNMRQDSSSFTVLMCVKGNATIEYPGGCMTLSQGRTVLVPAILTDYTLKGNAVILISRS